LFDRVYRLLVGPKSGCQGLEITELRISFDIKKTAKKTPNRSCIRVWNLQKSTRQELEKPDTQCLLYAGYSEDMGAQLIFQGGVTYAWSKQDGPDVVTEFELGDGSKQMRDSTISVGYASGVKSTTVLNDVSKQMDMPLVMPSNAPERTWQNGLSYYGSATGLLDKVTQGTGLEWSVQNEQIQVIQQGMVTTRQGVELALDSGLVYSPERLRKSANAARSKRRALEGKPEYDGWKVKALLMPQLNCGDRLKLSSRFVDGIFRIQELSHKGDSWQGEWITELKLIDPAAPISGETKTKGGVPMGMEDVEI